MVAGNPYLRFQQDAQGERAVTLSAATIILALVLGLALALGLAQVVGAVVAGLVVGGAGPAWIHGILPNGVLTRLLGGDFAQDPGWYSSPPITLGLAAAWCVPPGLWAWRVMVRSDL